MRSKPVLVLLAGLACLSVLGVNACGDEKASLRFDHEVRVERLRFFPSSIVVGVGSRVRWVNVQRKDTDTARTVTSGAGPADADAGMLFDATIDGFGSGETEGEDFIYKFSDIGTFSYFTRFPDGEEFGGTIIVQGQ